MDPKWQLRFIIIAGLVIVISFVIGQFSGLGASLTTPITFLDLIFWVILFSFGDWFLNRILNKKNLSKINKPRRKG